MCNRQKPISKQEIEDIQNEIKLAGNTITRLMNKANRTKFLSEEDYEVIKKNQKFINDHSRIVKAYYAPASV